MRTETHTRNIYKYDELSDNAKKTVIEQLSEFFELWPDNSVFYEDCIYRVNSQFPHSDLKVQYSLYNMQGDGFNIYGNLYLPDVVSHINLSEDEKVLLKYAFDNFGDSCNMEYNSHSYHCICDGQNFIDEILDNIAWDEDIVEEEVNQLGFTVKQLYSTLDKFNEETQEYFTNLCDDFEKQGYEFFSYKLSDEEASKICNANDYEFDEEGNLI